jgi:hypothetical protein
MENMENKKYEIAINLLNNRDKITRMMKNYHTFRNACLLTHTTSPSLQLAKTRLHIFQ